MYFFNVFIVIALVVVTYFAARVFDKDFKIPKKFIRLGVLIFVVVALAVWFTRIPLNTRLYSRIQGTDEIVIFTGEGEEHKNVMLEPAEYQVQKEHMGDAPVFAKTEDVRLLYSIMMGNSSIRHIEELNICELINPTPYADYLYYEYGGKYYCFICTKTLYNSAFYVFDPAFAHSALEAMAPYLN